MLATAPAALVKGGILPAVCVVLCVVAHPDDMEYGAAAAVAVHAEPRARPEGRREDDRSGVYLRTVSGR